MKTMAAFCTTKFSISTSKQRRILKKVAQTLKELILHTNNCFHQFDDQNESMTNDLNESVKNCNNVGNICSRINLLLCVVKIKIKFIYMYKYSIYLCIYSITLCNNKTNYL